MRLVDVQLAFPFILLAIIIMFVLGQGFANVVVVLIITTWPMYARVARAETRRAQAQTARAQRVSEFLKTVLALPDPSWFNAQDQFFASRGYAVAHIGVRGTPGFGREFLNAGDFQLAGKVVADLDDAVDYLARTGRIDPRRVAILGDGLGGLSGLHTAAVSNRFHAVVAYDPICDLTATSIGWLSSSRADTPTIVKQAGGTKAAYDLVHQFEPDSFMEKLTAPVLLVKTSWYGLSNDTGGKRIRGSMDRHRKVYEWYELDLRDYEHVKNETYLAKINTQIADYLDRTLK